MSLDVVVVSYKTPGYLSTFLKSLDLFEPQVDCTLTIVEVEAGEEETRWAWGSNGQVGTRIETATNIGYARSCNMAARRGGGDVIAFFNADVVLQANALDRCHDELMAHDDWAVLGPRQVDSRGCCRHAGIFGTNARPAHRGWNELIVGTNRYTDVREAVTVAGSAYFVKRKVWDELTECPFYQAIAPDAEGAFLPTPHYYEETYLSYHARSHGYRVVYFGETTIIHEWHQSSPHGGWADQQIPISQAYFRAACDHHGIDHD